ncbi:MAG: class I SAM-dependent methyltransferase [Thermoprotei archaeon]|jgi:ubiquinone/menaquinone biosynthesis C-methylase UbiE
MELKIQKIYETFYKNNPVLDVGVGFGKNLNMLLSRFKWSDVVGVDPNFETLSSVLSLARDWRVHLIVAVAEALPFRESVFALVSSWATMHHITHKYNAIIDMRRVLSNEGIIVIADWNEGGRHFTPHSGEELRTSMRETIKNVENILSIINESVDEKYFIIVAKKSAN